MQKINGPECKSSSISRASNADQARFTPAPVALIRPPAGRRVVPFGSQLLCPRVMAHVCPLEQSAEGARPTLPRRVPYEAQSHRVYHVNKRSCSRVGDLSAFYYIPFTA